MTPQETVEALAGRPLTLAEVALMNDRADAALAQSLSVGRTKQDSVRVSMFAAWCASTGLRAKVEDMSLNTASPMRSAALAILDMLSWSAGSFDLSASPAGQGNLGMLNAWVAAGIVTPAQRDSLFSLATITAPIDCNTISNILNGA